MNIFSVKRLVFIGLLVAIGAGFYFRNDFGTRASEAPRPRGPAAVPVQVAMVEQRSVPVRVEAIGNVEAYTTVQIKARVDGQITEVNFREGQEVRRGEVLFRIDSRPFEASLRQAEAAAARDRAQLERARAQEKRYKELLEKSFVSADGYAQIQTNAQTAEAVARASEAAVENARVQLDYTTIRAPVDGFVGKVLLQRGNIARANDANPIVVINQVHPIYVSFAVPEQRLAEIRNRMKSGPLMVDAVPSDAKGRAVSGKLAFIDNAVDPTTGTIKLRAQFDNTDNALWPGQFASVSLKLYDDSDALVVPSRSVQTGPNGQFVFLVKPDSTVEVRPVTIARSESDIAVIGKGVAKGERVVTEGQLRLAPGSRVAIREEAAASL
jgi:multidrug efflux system membrane fusion protein